MTVHLVGAGPGDPELLTLKAARLLAEADAVVADRLVTPSILEMIRPGAEFHDVGKTPGRPGPTQDHINRLLVGLGSRHGTVVRLKGGDPFVFGRGAEEAEACIAAGLEVEVVPGISSAVAAPAAAGISVTKRNVASGVSIVTAHQDSASDPLDWDALASGVSIVTAHQDSASDPLDWDALAVAGTTLVILMGARRAGQIRDRLLSAGMAGSTPVAVVTEATRLAQSTWTGPLHSLGVDPVANPSVIVVGEVSGADDRLALGELLDRHPALR